MKKRKEKKIKQIKFFKNKKVKLLRRKKRFSKRKKGKFSKKNSNIAPKVIKKSFFEPLVKKDFYHKVNFKNGKCTITIPNTFSFSQNANETIEILKMIVFAGINKDVKIIEFDHTKCVELGICASTIMDVLLMEIKEYRQKLTIEESEKNLKFKTRKKVLRIKGKLQSEGKIKDILEVSGILKHLGFEFEEKVGFKKLELISNGRPGLVSTKVVSYISDCLSTQKRILSNDGKNILSELVGEVIANCSEHAGESCNYYTLGHYFSDKDNNFGECCLTIFNFGQSIYESLQKSTKTICKILKQATNRHRRYFVKGKWNEESLWTVYALQDGISRCRDKKKDPDRGSGTIKLIEHFTDIGNKRKDVSPVMSLTSGHINILFSDKTRLETKKYGKYERKVIAFNENNNLSLPSDSENVRILENYFPGTVLSMKFYIAPNYIKDADGGNSNEY